MIQAFHGSPGSPEDFSALKAALTGIDLRALPRKGYPGSSSSQNSANNSDSVLLGYSWGCADALRSAVLRLSNDQPLRAVILIAPYLFPPNKTGALKKALISLPVLGNLLLSKAAPKVIEELLIKSSHPAPVTEAYRQATQLLKDPRVLRRAVIEKEEPGLPLIDCLSQLRARKIPLLLIRGDSDQSSSEAQQILPIRSSGVVTEEHCILRAGHALTYTHPIEVAELVAKFVKKYS